MDSAITSGIFTIVGVIIGSISSYFINKDAKELKALNRRIQTLQEKNDSLKNDIYRLCKQISAYWQVEKVYSEEVAKRTGKSSKTILEKYRNQIEANGYERPTMTEKGARKILENL